jgi:hypothetical protein
MSTMNSQQMFMIVTIVAALSVVMIATPSMAQNMTGGNMTGGNMSSGNMSGKISGYEEDAECSKSPACIT